MSDNILPFEIQIEIIKRAPVKSIIRFRSVSKTWRSLIDSSQFISGYRTRKTQPPSLLVRYKDKSDWYRDYYCHYVAKYVSVNEDTFTQQQDLTPNVPTQMKLTSDSEDVFISGYSRGLLCLFRPGVGGKWFTVVLWNPSIRRCVGILGCPNSYEFFGFAVCPVTNEPIIVKFLNPWKAEVFTFSSNHWTTIQCSNPLDRECESVSLHEGRQVVIDSCIYRVAYETVDFQNGSFIYQNMIVSFDLNAKEFKAIDLPDTITTSPITSPIRFILSKLKGSLVVIVPRREIREIKVWKMEPDCSFTQLFTINTSSFITDILGFRKNGELLVETQEKYFTGRGSALEVYDPCSKQITNLGMYGRSGSFFISSYKETLLLLDHSNSCKYPVFD